MLYLVVIRKVLTLHWFEVLYRMNLEIESDSCHEDDKSSLYQVLIVRSHQSVTLAATSETENLNFYPFYINQSLALARYYVSFKKVAIVEIRMGIR